MCRREILMQIYMDTTRITSHCRSNLAYPWTLYQTTMQKFHRKRDLASSVIDPQEITSSVSSTHSTISPSQVRKGKTKTHSIHQQTFFRNALKSTGSSRAQSHTNETTQALRLQRKQKSSHSQISNPRKTGKDKMIYMKEILKT